MPRADDGIDRDERRRSPRFSCAGEARIYCLPSDGVHVPGMLRNLSQGGICLDTSHAFDVGARTEILVSVSAASFRTLGLVRAVEDSRASIEFVQMSAGSRDLLSDLIEKFERLAAVADKLRSGRVETAEELRRETEKAGIRVARLGERDLSIPWLIGRSGSDRETGQPADRERIMEVVPMVIKVDLFG